VVQASNFQAVFDLFDFSLCEGFGSYSELVREVFDGSCGVLVVGVL